MIYTIYIDLFRKSYHQLWPFPCKPKNKKAIELNPTHIKAYTGIGIAHKNLGKYKEAIADYTKAIELDPTDAIAYNNRGIVPKI